LDPSTESVDNVVKHLVDEAHERAARARRRRSASRADAVLRFSDVASQM